MKKLSFILFVLSLTFISCNNDDSSATQEQEKAKLDRMYEEIAQLSGNNTQQCTDPNDWGFTTIAPLACGGNSYIVYSKKTNTTVFLDKVKAYNQSYADFNKKWNILILCDNMVIQPTGVKCVDGKPQLSYDPVLY
ncbi:hypothetical protein [Flavobacterium sp. KACC 22763]|uniref:hypothetical protein n=1 Tax=Flavobacterium sp. KACC 22763 TaxID=3025668 RepID=UPI00236570D9|nr:hypothetical protein [Flavobacterium sp. KACC 22763]WDF64978.1 hypothetical protein PQ463_02230 [Flavobacterium sp. KACC 22763]